MTDTEHKRIKAICEVAGVKEIEDVSDGYHTFKQLYYQRMMLFAALVKQNRDKAWKSLRHEDGELCFGGGWFIVGIDTPEGSYTYHYEDNFYSLFDCTELECGKHWDGHTEEDVTRLLSLEQNICDDAISRQRAISLAKDLKQDLPDDEHLADMVMAHNDGVLEYQTQLSLLPPINSQEPKTGHWISRNSFLLQYKCSECGWESEKYNFCPNCGAKMIEPQERREE